MRRLQHLFLLSILAGGLIPAETATASNGSGLSFGIGTASMSASESKAYLEADNDLYAEVQAAYDNGPVKLELHVGIIEVKSGHVNYSGSTSWDEEVSFVPIEVDLNLLPLRLVGQGHSAFQPYVGIGVGLMVGSAKGAHYEDKNLPIAPVIRGGVEFYIGNRHIIGLDIAHHGVVEGDSGLDYSFTTVMLNYRFRFPLAK